ncbi:MAG: rod shape-determining protein RodA [Candidatus Zixiibacteriota bacterium]
MVGRIDPYLFLPALLLSLIGILLIFSALQDSSDHEASSYLRQLVWLAMGLLVFVAVSAIAPRIYESLSILSYLVALLLLVSLFFFGASRLGATRWLSIGSLNLQPSEFAKAAVILLLARYLANRERPQFRVRWALFSFLVVLLPALLILKQPDLGSSLVVVAVVPGMLFWGGMPIAHIALLLSPVVSLLAAFHWLSWAIFMLVLIVTLFVVRPTLRFAVWVLATNLAAGIFTPLVWQRLHDYQKMRILTFLNPARDPQGAGYQIIQSKIAIGSGGLLGKGFLEGTQSKLAYLPARHTDFIFSVLGEEFGLLGCLVVLILFSVIILRGVQVARKARNHFLSLTAFGATTILAFQVLVNVGVTTGLAPVTGLPLPFMSYGGSSMLLSWSLIGLLCLVSYTWQEY